MTEAEIREGARQFYQKWVNKGKEDEDDRSYWLDIFGRILGVNNATDYIEFQKKVIVDGHTKKIDAYIPETKVLIEQKSLGIALDKKLHQSGGIMLTPYEQAKRYNDNLPYDEKARWIITCNFSEIWIYDMNMRIPEPIKLSISELTTKFTMLDFIVNQERVHISQEAKLTWEAGELIGIIYDKLYNQYFDPTTVKAKKSLNILCVRLVFCLYAEDAGVFGSNHNIFHDYLANFSAENFRKGLIELFDVLDTKPENRDKYDTSLLSKFPYVNGGLFSEKNIEIPNFTEEIKEIILVKCSENFDWSKISPTIFGSLFESTLNPETRHSGGMHYTSIQDIHKVIDPLFLDDLKQELFKIKQLKTEKIKVSNLKAYQNKLSKLKFLDPACGSGNFLTETYICLRRLENEVLKELQKEQIVLGIAINPIKVLISQFYGIEINDFAVTVAKTALWIAESQMMKETEDVVCMELDFLPLKTNANIIEGNALKLNWKDIVSPLELSYIMGNPPFLGAMYMSQTQKNEIRTIFSDVKGAGELDYVCAWYKLATEFMRGTKIRAAFVSTNSICQGEQVLTFWKYMIERYNIHIDYAYTTFEWDNNTKGQAKVHCVIIGFSGIQVTKTVKQLFGKDGEYKVCQNINPYLIDAKNYFITSRSTPICNIPSMRFGSMPRDGGGFVLTAEEKDEFIKKEPLSKQWIKPYVGATEFLNNKERYCLWLVGAEPGELNKCPMVMKRIEAVKNFRANSKAAGTRKFALTPTLFCQIAQPNTNYIIVPKTSSGKRRYLPLGFMDKDTIASDLVFLIPNAELYHFGVLMSNVHNAWMRVFAGRLKSDYRYSKDIVYNNFPWPSPTEEQKIEIEKSAQAILDARNLYKKSSLASLYNPKTMPIELKKAHDKNNAAVMKAYGFSIRNMSEDDCVPELMKLYENIVS